MGMNCVYNGQKMVLFNIRNSYILRPKLPKTPIFLAKILLYSSYILRKTWLTACICDFSVPLLQKWLVLSILTVVPSCFKISTHGEVRASIKQNLDTWVWPQLNPFFRATVFHKGKHKCEVIPCQRRRDIDLALSVCPSQTCWGYISKTITDLNMKLKGCVVLIEEKCTAQEP